MIDIAQIIEITQMMERLHLSDGQRPVTRDTRSSSVRRRMKSSQCKANSNVCLLSVYLDPTAYDKGVKFIAKMNYYYKRRDPAHLKLFMKAYSKTVAKNDVARFRAKKKINELYGDLIG